MLFDVHMPTLSGRLVGGCWVGNLADRSAYRTVGQIIHNIIGDFFFFNGRWVRL